MTWVVKLQRVQGRLLVGIPKILINSGDWRRFEYVSIFENGRGGLTIEGIENDWIRDRRSSDGLGGLNRSAGSNSSSGN